MEINFNQNAVNLFKQTAQPQAQEYQELETESLFGDSNSKFLSTANELYYKELEKTYLTGETELNFTSVINIFVGLLNKFFGENSPKDSVVSTPATPSVQEPATETFDTPQSKIMELEKQKVQLNADISVAADEYVEALNNKILMFTYVDSGNSGIVKKEELTYKNFTSDANSVKYRLVDPKTGKIICTDKREASRYVNINDYANFDPNGSLSWKDENAESNYNQDCESFYRKNMTLKEEYKNKETLQNALQSGSLIVEKLNLSSSNGRINTEWDYVPTNKLLDVSSELYTADDSAATAQYEYKVLQYEAQIADISAQVESLKAQEHADNLTNSAKTELEKLSAQKAQLNADKLDAAAKYRDALNNKTLMFTFTASVNDGRTYTEELTYNSFTSDANAIKYRIIDPASGKIVCTDPTEAKRYVNINDYANFDADGNLVGWKEGKTEADYNNACQDFYNKNMILTPELEDKNSLQNALSSGAVLIERQSVKAVELQQQMINEKGELVKDKNGKPVMETIVKQEIVWDLVSMSSLDDVSEEFYTDDDNVAMAQYEAANLKINAQIKEIDSKIEQIKSNTNNQLQSQPEKKDYLTRQIERYEKYISKYEKQIEVLEASDDANKDAKINALMNKIDKYMNKIQELID